MIDAHSGGRVDEVMGPGRPRECEMCSFDPVFLYWFPRGDLRCDF